MAQQEKKKEIDLSKSTPEQIAKALGGDIAVLDSIGEGLEIEVVETKLKSLDLALGGGVPLGRLIELYGYESAGKTGLCLHFVAQFQKAGLKGAYIDAEHSLDMEYARGLGVDTSKLLFSQPDSAEEGIHLIERLLTTRAVSLIVLDSVAAMNPANEEFDSQQPAVQARMFSKAWRGIVPLAARSGTTILAINHLRDKIGVVWGAKTTTPGGNALKFYSSQRIEVKRAGQVLSKDNVVGLDVNITVAKNKIAPPFRKAELRLIFGKGWSERGKGTKK